MGNSEIAVLLLMFALACAQYKDSISDGGPTPAVDGGHSDSGASYPATKAPRRNPASIGSLDPKAPLPIPYPPFQEDPSYPYQQQEIYPLIIASNGTDPNEEIYLENFPMQILYQQNTQDNKADPRKSSYIPVSQKNINSNPYENTIPYPDEPYDPTVPSDAKDDSDPNTSPHHEEPPYPATPSYPKDEYQPSTSSYPKQPSDPSADSYPNNPSNPSEPNDPSYPSGPSFAKGSPDPSTSDKNDPSYPATPSNPSEPSKPSTAYNKQPTGPSTPSYPKNPADPSTAPRPTNPSYPTNPDQPPQDISYHVVKPPAKLSPCASYSDGKTYGVSDVCFAYYECKDGEDLYRQCDDHYKFDEVSGQCVPDISCMTACPDQWKPHPTDIYKFILGGKEMSCPYGTFFDYKICSCQSKNNLPKDYRR